MCGGATDRRNHFLYAAAVVVQELVEESGSVAGKGQRRGGSVRHGQRGRHVNKIDGD